MTVNVGLDSLALEADKINPVMLVLPSTQSLWTPDKYHAALKSFWLHHEGSDLQTTNSHMCNYYVAQMEARPLADPMLTSSHTAASPVSYGWIVMPPAWFVA